MEEWEREVIRKRLPDLLNDTTVNPVLLATLQAENVISRADISAIKSTNDSYEQKSKLYDVIVTRTNGYNLLLEALTKAGQTGAEAILLDGKRMANRENQSKETEPAGESDGNKNVSNEILVVGEDNCPLDRLVLAMLSTPVSSMLDDKWKTIALGLGTSIALKKRLTQQKLLGNIEMTDVLEEILQEWVNRRVKEATLQEFIKILEKNAMNAIAQSVKDEFKI